MRLCSVYKHVVCTTTNVKFIIVLAVYYFGISDLWKCIWSLISISVFMWIVNLIDARRK